VRALRRWARQYSETGHLLFYPRKSGRLIWWSLRNLLLGRRGAVPFTLKASAITTRDLARNSVPFFSHTLPNLPSLQSIRTPCIHSIKGIESFNHPKQPSPPQTGQAMCVPAAGVRQLMLFLKQPIPPPPLAKKAPFALTEMTCTTGSYELK
jgi:hypothetical protein